MVTSSSVFDPILDRCIASLLEQGKPVEACLLDFPEHKDALEPLLRLAFALQTAGSLQAPADFRMSSASRMNNLIAGVPRRESPIQNRWQRLVRSRWAMLGRAIQRVPANPRFSWVYVTILLVLMLSLTSWGIVNAADQSLPGDALYPVKLRVEGVQLFISTTPVENSRLQIKFTQERFIEVVSLAEQQRAANFSNAIQGYTHQLTATMATLADEQYLPQVDRADLSRVLLDDLTDNEFRLNALLLSIPEKYPLPADFRTAVEEALALIQSSCEQARIWSGLPPANPQSSSPSILSPLNTAQATPHPAQTKSPSPTSTPVPLTPVPLQAARTPSPKSETSDPNVMFTDWPSEWPPLEETLIPAPQWTEVNMPWPTQIALPTAWPTDLMPLPTIIQEYWPTDLPPVEIPDESTPPAWPPDPDEPPDWPSEDWPSE